jgi:hypothetical protein
LSSTTAAPARQPVAAPQGAWRIPPIKAPYVFSSLITLILVVGQWKFGIVGGWDRLGLALGTALAVELLLGRLVRGRWPNLLSAYITGNSVAILSKPAPGILWPYWIGASVAITSKYVLQYRGRHLWNPTNFSFCALLLVAPHSMSLLSHQWGNDVITLIVFAVGMAVVWRAGLMHISGTYAVSFITLAFVRALLIDQAGGGDLWFRFVTEVAPITGPMYMLLMFFMLTDPRTVVSTKSGRIKVVVLIALVEFGIRLLQQTSFRGLDVLLTGPPIFALGIVGPIALALELRRKALAAPAPARAV